MLYEMKTALKMRERIFVKICFKSFQCGLEINL